MKAVISMLRKHLLLIVLALLIALVIPFGAVSMAEKAAADESDYSLLSTLDNGDTDDVIRMLFAAAAGTDTETERAARKKMNASQQQERNARNAAYRERVLPWLLECFADLLKKNNSTAQTNTARPDRPDNESFGSGAAIANTAETAKAVETAETAQTRTTIKIKVNNTTSNSAMNNNAVKMPDGAEPSADSGSDTGGETRADTAETQKKALLEAAFSAFEETDTGRAYLSKMKSLGAEDAEGALTLTRAFCSDWLAKINAEVMAAANPDYECWIYCPDTMIDYPVMHGTDNSYYMSHLPNGADNRYGSLFIDFRNLRKLQDPNTLIYGHHMKNGAMFKALSWYSEQAFYEAHPYMLLITPDMVYVLQIFAGRVVDESDRSADIALGDPQALLDYAKTAAAQSKFKASVTVQPTDRLVTLSTCAYDTWDSRYLLTGRLLPCGSENITVVFSPYAEALDDSGGAWG